MAAEQGNNYWTYRKKHGKPPKFLPEDLWDEFVKYCKWLNDNPLKEDVLFSYQGKVIHEGAKKMRAPTLKGFFVFTDISHTTWDNYKLKQDYLAITTRIEDIMYAMKFEGAAAGLLNSNLIARELGKGKRSFLSGA